MTASLPFLIAKGDWIGFAVAGLFAIAGAAVGWRLALWRAARARSKTGDPEVSRMVQASSIDPRAYGAAGGAAVALATWAAIGYGSLRLAEKAPSIGLRWTSASVAATTPWRSRALAAAAEALELRISEPLPAVRPTNLHEPLTIALQDKGPLEQYVALSRLRNDCESAPEFLVNLASAVPGAAALAADRALECGLKKDVVGLARIHFWHGDLAQASALYERAAMRWGTDDKKELFAESLARMNARQEVFTHWLAGRLAVAGDTLDRNGALFRSSGPRAACARETLALVAGDAPARARLQGHADDPVCAAHLAAVETPEARRPLLERANENDGARTTYLFQLRALETDSALDPNVPWRKAANASRYFVVETPHELLSFPHGALVEEPALVLAALQRAERIENPRAPVRLVRARLRATAARFESSLGNHDAARALVKAAQDDYHAVVAFLRSPEARGQVPLDDNYVLPFTIEATLCAALEVGVELVAGRTEVAQRLADALPPIDARPGGSVFDSEGDRARASVELVRAFVELWQGRPDRVERFVASEACSNLPSCFVVRGDRESLVAAARGDANVESCEHIVCLIAARNPSARPALARKLESLADTVAVELNPIVRLNRIGTCRRLALAIGDTEHLALFDRWLAATRDVSLEPRLAVALRTVEFLHMK